MNLLYTDWTDVLIPLKRLQKGHSDYGTNSILKKMDLRYFTSVVQNYRLFLFLILFNNN